MKRSEFQEVLKPSLKPLNKIILVKPTSIFESLTTESAVKLEQFPHGEQLEFKVDNYAQSRFSYSTITVTGLAIFGICLMVAVYTRYRYGNCYCNCNERFFQGLYDF